MIRVLASVLLVAVAVGANAHDQGQGQQLTFFTIGSGDVTGGYFSVARAICDSINQAENGKLRCSPDPSSGSLYNLSMLKKGELDFALVQSDWQRLAYEGRDIYSDYAAMPNLRSVMGLYPETITVIVSAESGIARPAGLIGKRVDIGPPSSGRYASISRLLEVLDYKLSDFKSTFGFTQARAIDELCAGHIDATIFIVGHPNKNVARAMDECGARMISFDGPLIETSLGAATDYQKILIPWRTYPDLAPDVNSYAVFSTIVTRADTDPELVETFVVRTLENLDDLSIASTVLAGVTVEGLRSNGLTAPLHPGAERAYSAANSKVKGVRRDTQTVSPEAIMKMPPEATMPPGPQ